MGTWPDRAHTKHCWPRAGCTPTCGTAHRLAGRKTVILISHRLANVTKADNIYVLDHGHLAGQGTHEALLAQGGLYADLWNRQQALENYGKGAQ